MGDAPRWFMDFLLIRICGGTSASSKKKSGVLIFDAQAGKGNHSSYLYTNYKEDAVGSHTNLQLLLTKEVL